MKFRKSDEPDEQANLCRALAVTNIITIELLGEAFKFRAEENSTLEPSEIAAYLMEEVQRAESGFPVHSRKSNKMAIMVMAALNIAKKHIELLDDHTDFLQTVSTRAARLDRIIDPGV